MFISKNSILSSLPAADVRQLSRSLAPIKLERGQTLAAAGKPLRGVYFVESGLVSIVTTMQSGRTVEVAVVGRDGFVGIPALLGTSSLPNRAFVQIPGSAFRLDANQSRLWMERKNSLRDSSLRFLQGYLVQASQTAACNRLHGISERLARWLLLCHDRVGQDQIDITQQNLSEMLGAPRATVTLAAGILKKNGGSISYTRGKVQVINRINLEKSACECYAIITDEYRRLSLL